MSSEAPTPSRITSIDALRGLTVAFMILVNDPGDWAHIYPQLDHAEWNGFTLTDFVFPNFLFLVGCSIVFSLSARVARGVSRRALALQVVRRAAIIFALKMFLSAYPHFHLSHMRIFGVLTRIALCYLLTALIFLITQRPRTLAAITVALLLGYWILLRFVPIPGLGHPVHDFPILDENRNLTAWIDRGFSGFTLRWLHTGRLYRGTNDPEGLLSTLPSVATTLFGVLAAQWLRRPGAPSQTVSPSEVGSSVQSSQSTRDLQLLVGLVCVILGLVWNIWFPINKNLWTSSYVLFAGGLSLIALALSFWLLDDPGTSPALQQRCRILVRPLLIFGSNAITAFVFSELIVLTLSWVKVPRGDGRQISLWGWIYAHLFAFHGSTQNTSLAFALAFVALCFVPNWLLWRRKLFLRI